MRTLYDCTVLGNYFNKELRFWIEHIILKIPLQNKGLILAKPPVLSARAESVFPSLNLVKTPASLSRYENLTSVYFSLNNFHTYLIYTPPFSPKELKGTWFSSSPFNPHNTTEVG